MLPFALNHMTAPKLGWEAFADLAAGLTGSQVLIDFTRPEGTMAHLRTCVEHGVKLVIGTTGFSDAQKAEIAEALTALAGTVGGLLALYGRLTATKGVGG